MLASQLAQSMLLDIGLPTWDGIEVARRVRRLRDGASVKLVAVTGWGQKEVVFTRL